MVQLQTLKQRFVLGFEKAENKGVCYKTGGNAPKNAFLPQRFFDTKSGRLQIPAENPAT